jgi:hypothetical protein
MSAYLTEKVSMSPAPFFERSGIVTRTDSLRRDNAANYTNGVYANVADTLAETAIALQKSKDALGVLNRPKEVARIEESLNYVTSLRFRTREQFAEVVGEPMAAKVFLLQGTTRTAKRKHQEITL